MLGLASISLYMISEKRNAFSSLQVHGPLYSYDVSEYAPVIVYDLPVGPTKGLNIST